MSDRESVMKAYLVLKHAGDDYRAPHRRNDQEPTGIGGNGQEGGGGGPATRLHGRERNTDPGDDRGREGAVREGVFEQAQARQAAPRRRRLQGRRRVLEKQSSTPSAGTGKHRHRFPRRWRMPYRRSSCPSRALCIEGGMLGSAMVGLWVVSARIRVVSEALPIVWLHFSKKPGRLRGIKP